MGDLRVFLSHTSDLDAPSNEAASFVGTAIHAIAALPGFSVEEQRTTFTAEDQTSAEVVRRRLARCDIYVGIVGYAHGTAVEGDPAGRSFVELEFDTAREAGLPRIVLMLDADAARAAGIAQPQSAFRARLEATQELVFARFNDGGELRLALEHALAAFRPAASEHVSCHVEWAAPAELGAIGVDPRERRWAIYVRNAGEYPAYDVIATVHSNNGRDDYSIDMGTLAARDVMSTPYILNLERESFDPDGDRPVVELSFTMSGIHWHRRPDGSLVPARRRPAAQSGRPRTRG
jgi:hypothetical protein